MVKQLEETFRLALGISNLIIVNNNLWFDIKKEVK